MSENINQEIYTELAKRIYDLDGGNIAPSIYYGLTSLQHRGQESCGIAVSDTSGPKGHVKSYKGLGLVNEVVKESKLEELSGWKGNRGIGHVRYSTAGGTRVENAQPLVLNYLKGSLALSHNGNLVNAMELREQMENTGAIFHTSIDSEIIAYGIARERVHSKTVEEAILRTVKEIRGAYALVIMSPRKLIGVRDPYGLKPLCIGKRDNAWVLASESCALTSIGAEFVRDVAPGEIVTFDKTGNLKSEFMPVDVKKAHCIFEYIYFARLDSKIDNISVYEARIRGGATLAKTYPVDADLVCGVPDSGLASAKGYSEESGIPFGLAFHKNSYVGRTFIKPKQSSREQSVRVKLNVVKEAVAGKRIIMIDDSIVRGTQLGETTEFLYQSGAKEVHIRPACPPLMFGCPYLNFSRSTSELDLITRRIIRDREGDDVSREVLNSYTDPDSANYKEMIEEIRKRLGFTTLRYHRLDDLVKSIGISPCKLCTYCWSGRK